MKNVMILAVPGIDDCTENNLCIAVVVKNPNKITKLIELENLVQYFARASNVLQNLSLVSDRSHSNIYWLTYFCPSVVRHTSLNSVRR